MIKEIRTPSITIAGKATVDAYDTEDMVVSVKFTEINLQESVRMVGMLIKSFADVLDKECNTMPQLEEVGIVLDEAFEELEDKMQELTKKLTPTPVPTPEAPKAEDTMEQFITRILRDIINDK